MDPRAILFDLDGTLWDSYPVYASALDGGGPESSLIGQLRAGANVFALARELSISRGKLIARIAAAARDVSLYPTVRETLGALVESGIALGVVTNLPGTVALPMLRALEIDEAFGVVVHAGVCRKPKPNPHGLLMACEALSVEPDESVIYIGDRESDQRAARAAGVRFAWASYGYTDGELEADLVLCQLGELVAG